MDTILKWWENTFGGNNAIWNIRLMAKGLLLIFCFCCIIFWQAH